MGKWDGPSSREAHDRFIAVADESAANGDWRPWAEMFTPDAEYIEHHYGKFHGRAEILTWNLGHHGRVPTTR